MYYVPVGYLNMHIHLPAQCPEPYRNPFHIHMFTLTKLLLLTAPLTLVNNCSASGEAPPLFPHLSVLLWSIQLTHHLSSLKLQLHVATQS